MLEENKNDVVFFPKETTYQIGKVTYVVISCFDDSAEPLIKKIKNLLKADIQNELVRTGVPGANPV